MIDGDGRISSLGGGLGPPIGASRSDRTQSGATLSIGADLLAFTDGLIERRRESIDTSRERLTTQLARLSGAPIADVVDEVLRTVPDSVHDGDIALLALRRTGA